MGKQYCTMDIQETLSYLETSGAGLDPVVAQQRLSENGPNELTKTDGTPPLVILLNQFKSIIIYILIGATIISALLEEWVDAIVIFVILILNALMGFIQEYKAEKSIEALKQLASPQAVVLRGGQEQKVLTKELVPGDIIILEAGVKLPADGRLISAINLQTQEGALTGESVPSQKTTKTLQSGLSLGDQANMVFAGTIITSGRGRAVITETGMNTEIGKIAGMLQQTTREPTHLQQKLADLGKWLGIVTIIICALVFGTGVLQGGDVAVMFLAAVSLAVAAIPEGMPAVITIALGIGVQKMVKKHALIRNLPSVETLGAVTVICTDKTGTLTHNQMTVTKLYTIGKEAEVHGSGYAPHGSIVGMTNLLLLRIGVLCNDARLVRSESDWSIIGDPTEGSLLTVARKAGLDEENLREKIERLDEIGFDSERKMMTTFHKIKGVGISYTKGAPDVIIKKCTHILDRGKVRKLTPKDHRLLMAKNEEYSSQALRVLAFAYNKNKSREHAEKKMIFVGLQAMIDPPREEVKEAIAKCKSAGIRVIMITGDHLATASAIAKQLGITGKAIEGRALAKCNLKKEVGNIGIYARVNPEHKLRIVKALQDQNQIVAMTGDGVNDAPALKQANIGVAMGITGTDVAKEASAMILTDDNFASIVSAVEEGRNIYDNIKKFVNYLLSSNIGEVLILFMAMIIGYQVGGVVVLPLIAIQILWVNLITDGFPALALGVDPPDPKIMIRKPRQATDAIVSKNMMWNIGVIGVLVTLGVLLAFGSYLGQGVEKAQTIALTLLVVLEIVRLEMIRSQYNTGFFSNGYLTLAIGGVLVLQLGVIYSPLRHLFHLTPLAWIDWIWIVMISAAMLGIGKLAAILIKHMTAEDD